jgi:hypothetical protein
VLSSTNYGWRRRKFHPAEPRPGRELSFRSEKLLAVGSVYYEKAMSARHLDGADAAMERYARGDEAAFADVYDAIARACWISCARRLGTRSPRRT